MSSSSDLWQEHYKAIQDFNRKAISLGHDDPGDYFWYHTIDLGDGLVTPGCHDYRETLSLFQFPPDMTGMTVLDVGSATGFFAFEFEKRGARVVSVEMTSLADLDTFPGQDPGQTRETLKRVFREHFPYNPEQIGRLFGRGTDADLFHWLIEGPYQYCHKVLKSKVERCHCNIYDLSAARLGAEAFDWVFVGDVLVHTLYPLKALAAVAALCRGTLVIAQDLAEVSDSPVMVYVGGDKIGEDRFTWWFPNRLCFEQILNKLGFRKFEVVGRHTGTVKPHGSHFDRAILHASKS
jgi:tRNA (mo5U34)-methyltransferase